MRCLFIDSHVRGRVRLAVLASTGKVRVQEKEGRVSPVVAAARFFTAADRNAATGVCVVSGPGPFSAIRSGVLFANVLARLLRVPLVGVAAAEAEDLEVLRARLATGDIPSATFVAPIYDAEPNIC